MRRAPRRRARYQRRGRAYGAEVQMVVRYNDRALGHPCRERLKPMLPYMADHLHALGILVLDLELLAQLESISVSGVGRILGRVRQDEPRIRQRSRLRSVTQIQHQVPIGTIPWDERISGRLEVDLVQHSGL